MAVVVELVVAHPTTDSEIPDLIPVGTWVFSLHFTSLSNLSINGASLIRSLMEV